MSEADRALPHNPEAEQAILGAVLLDGKALVAAGAILKPKDFYVEAHQLIFRAMVSLSERSGTSIDAITVGDELGSDLLEKHGGLGYLSSLMDGLPRAVNVAHYAGIVKEKASLRCLIAAADTAYLAAYEGGAQPAAIIEKARAAMGDIGTNGAGGVRLTRADEVEASPVHWAWAGLVPLGGLTVLVGDPGLGKTTLAVEFAARVSRGQAEGDLAGTPAPVLMATAEDALSVLRARLEAAGAELSAVHFVSVCRDGLDVGLTLPDDVAELESKAATVGARLIIVDPISGHLSGGVDSHKDASLRKALAPLARMAEGVGAAVLALAHLNKTDATNLFRRVGGSVAFTAAARSVLLLAEDCEGGDLVLVHGKCNLGPLVAGRRLRIEGRDVPGAGGSSVPTSGVAWLGPAGDITVADVLTVTESAGRTARDEAAAWLRAYLDHHGGEAQAGDVLKAARKDDIVRATLHRARRHVGIVSEKGGFKGGWVWRLPDDTREEKSDSGFVTQGEKPSVPSCKSGVLSESTEGFLEEPEKSSVQRLESGVLSEGTEGFSPGVTKDPSPTNVAADVGGDDRDGGEVAALARADDAPTDDGYTSPRGTASSVALEDAKGAIERVAPTNAAAGRTLDDLLGDVDVKVSRATLNKAVDELLEAGVLSKVGKGVKGSAYKYFLFKHPHLYEKKEKAMVSEDDHHAAPATPDPNSGQSWQQEAAARRRKEGRKREGVNDADGAEVASDDAVEDWRTL